MFIITGDLVDRIVFEECSLDTIPPKTSRVFYKPAPRTIRFRKLTILSNRREDLYVDYIQLANIQQLASSPIPVATLFYDLAPDTPFSTLKKGEGVHVKIINNSLAAARLGLGFEEW